MTFDPIAQNNNCDGILVCGDTNFGCVEAIQEMPKFGIIVESKLCSKRLLISDGLQYEKEKMKLYLARFLIW